MDEFKYAMNDILKFKQRMVDKLEQQKRMDQLQLYIKTERLEIK